MNISNRTISCETDNSLKEIVELSILYDFYGELLSEHKRHIFEDYILNDLSLSEIAETAGISRQGVHDIIKRCSLQLHEYESKLMLHKKFNLAKEKINQIKAISAQIHEKSNLIKIVESDLNLNESIESDLNSIKASESDLNIYYLDIIRQMKTIEQISDEVLKEL